MGRIKYTGPAYMCQTCKKQKTPDAFYVSNKWHCKKCLIRKQRKSIAMEQKPEIAQRKLQRVLHMTVYLIQGKRSIKDFKQRFEISERTAYRYLNLIDSMEFGLEQGFDNRFFIVNEPCLLCGGNHLAGRADKPGKANATNVHRHSPAFN